MSTLAALIRYAAALASALAWTGLARLACLCDRETRRAWQAGEPFDRVDRAIARLDEIHREMFGNP